MGDDHGQSHTDAAPVQFGIFDWIDRNQLQLPDLYEQRLQCLEYADEAGFYCYHLAEHQGTPLGMAPSPGVFLAAVIQRNCNGWCRRLKLKTNVSQPCRAFQPSVGRKQRPATSNATYGPGRANTRRYSRDAST